MKKIYIAELESIKLPVAEDSLADVSIKVRSAYAQEYAKQYKKLGKPTLAKDAAYAQIGKQFGEKVLASLKAFHNKNANEDVLNELDLDSKRAEGEWRGMAGASRRPAGGNHCLKKGATYISCHGTEDEAMKAYQRLPNSMGVKIMREDINEGEYDYDGDEPELCDGCYVRDEQNDGPDGEVFKMIGDPEDRRVRIEDKDGRGWSIFPFRLTLVTDEAAIAKWFGPDEDDGRVELRQSQLDEYGNPQAAPANTAANTPVQAPQPKGTMTTATGAKVDSKSKPKQEKAKVPTSNTNGVKDDSETSATVAAEKLNKAFKDPKFPESPIGKEVLASIGKLK
jgi:hypothetical protein